MTTFSTGLNFPMGMVRLRDGSLLVGETVPTSTGTSFTSFYNGAGQIVRMVEQSKWGVASGSGTVVASGLPGAVTSVRLAGDILAVATTGNQAANYHVGDITFFRIGNPAGPYTKLGSIHVAFDIRGCHQPGTGYPPGSGLGWSLRCVLRHCSATVRWGSRSEH